MYRHSRSMRRSRCLTPWLGPPAQQLRRHPSEIPKPWLHDRGPGAGSAGRRSVCCASAREVINLLKLAGLDGYFSAVWNPRSTQLNRICVVQGFVRLGKEQRSRAVQASGRQGGSAIPEGVMPHVGPAQGLRRSGSAHSQMQRESAHRGRGTRAVCMRLSPGCLMPPTD